MNSISVVPCENLVHFIDGGYWRKLYPLSQKCFSRIHSATSGKHTLKLLVMMGTDWLNVGKLAVWLWLWRCQSNTVFWNMHNIINGKQMKDLEYYGDPNKYMVWNLQNIIKEKKIIRDYELSWATATNISFKIFVILMGKK